MNARTNANTTALMRAAWNGNPEVLALLLSSGAEVEVRDNAGKTALMKAAESGKVEAVKALLSAGADAQARDQANHDALWYAQHPGAWVAREDADAVIRLLDQGEAKP